MIDSVLLYLESKVNCLKNKLSTVEVERDVLKEQLELVYQSLDFRDIELEDANKKIKQLESALEEERQENASLRSGDDYERGAE